MERNLLSVTEATLADYRLLAVRKLPIVNVEDDLEWVCRSLGFLESRDKKKTAFRVFRSIIETARHDKGLTSDELAKKHELSRGTVIHHLNKLSKSGLVIHHESQYKLRGRSLKDTIEEVQRDINRIFEDLVKVSETIDDALDLVYR
jgi:predicted transcriptional regulator